MNLARNPTLESVLMVEKAIEKHSGEGPYQIWKKLPRKMSYQAFKTIVDYLIESNKVGVDPEGKIGWIWDPEGVRRWLKKLERHPELEWKG